jgi:hypothetical protein
MRCKPSIALSPVLALTLALAACASNPTGTEVATGSEFLLRPGESATVEGAQLGVRFDVVASDSRCPADVVCIQLGTAEAIFTTSEAGGPEASLTLRTSPGDGQRATVGAWTLTLVRLDPYPYTSRPIDASDYRAFLRVDPAS